MPCPRLPPTVSQGWLGRSPAVGFLWRRAIAGVVHSPRAPRFVPVGCRRRDVCRLGAPHYCAGRSDCWCENFPSGRFVARSARGLHKPRAIGHQRVPRSRARFRAHHCWCASILPVRIVARSARGLHKPRAGGNQKGDPAFGPLPSAPLFVAAEFCPLDIMGLPKLSGTRTGPRRPEE